MGLPDDRNPASISKSNLPLIFNRGILSLYRDARSIKTLDYFHYQFYPYIMPEALPATVMEIARALFYQGLKYSEISQQTGVKEATIRSWVFKKGWNTTKEQTKQALQQSGKASLALETAKDLTAQSKQLKEMVSQSLVDQMQVLKNKPAKSVKQVAGKDGHASTTLTIVKAASEVFGWSQDKGNSIVNIAFLNQVNENPELITEVNKVQVVEVETVESDLSSD